MKEIEIEIAKDRRRMTIDTCYLTKNMTDNDLISHCGIVRDSFNRMTDDDVEGKREESCVVFLFPCSLSIMLHT